MKTANTLSHEKKNNKMNQQTKRGFTLVELIVSMALFIIVVFITTSAFLSVVNLNKKARATRTAIDSLSIAMERMTRMIRTGTDYYCTNDETGFYNTSYVLSDLKTSIVSSSDAGDCTGEDFLLFESSEGAILDQLPANIILTIVEYKKSMALLWIPKIAEYKLAVLL